MRRPLLGGWPRRLGLGLIGLVAATVLPLLCYLPYELANNLLREYLASAPVSLSVIDYLYTPLGSSVNSLISVGSRVKDYTWPDNPYHLPDGITDDVLVPAHEGEQSIRIPGPWDDLWKRSTSPPRALITLAEGNATYTPVVGNHGPAPCVCSSLPVSITRTEEQLASETIEHAHDDFRFDSDFKNTSLNFWQNTKLHFRQSSSFILGLSIADQRLIYDPALCSCAPSATVIATEGGSGENPHPSSGPGDPRRHDRGPEDSDDEDEDWDALYGWWSDYDDDDEPSQPVHRIHDCAMDDPNWQTAWSLLETVQVRTCIPTYEPWEKHFNVTTQAADGCSYLDPSYHIPWSVGPGSAMTMCARGKREFEPIQTDDADDGSLVFGLHKRKWSNSTLASSY